MNSHSTNLPCIHAPICEACVVLQDVDEEILRMTSALQKLSKRRREVVTTVNRSHDRVTQIPPEITAHIFYLYAHNETSGVLKGIFTISLVSKSWRDIALSTPQLWTSITFSIHARRWDFPHDVAEMWLQRSGVLQVDVTLRWIVGGVTGASNADPRTWGAKVDQQFLNILHLLRNCSRVRQFQLQVPVNILPQLNFDPGSIQHFGLHLHNISTDIVNLYTPSALKQITCLRVDTALTAKSVLDILRQFPLLVEWKSLVVRRWHADTIIPGTHVQPMHLSTFEVEFQDDLFPLFVNALTMPSLQHFTVKFTMLSHVIASNPLTDISYMSGVLLRSPNLCDLSLHCTCVLARDKLAQFLADLYSLTQLRSLSLTFDIDYDEGWDPTGIILDPFLQPKPGPPFLPHLRYFRYSTPRLQPWFPIAAFYEYHSTDTTVRSLSVADFSGCAEHLPRGVIDKEPLQVFLTLPTTGLEFIFNLKLLAMSIEHHGLQTPGKDVMSFYTGLEKCLSNVRTFRRRVLWHLNPDTSLNDTLISDAEMDQDDESESTKVALHVY